MNANFEIVLPQGGHVAVGTAPLTVGRGMANDVVIADDTVSWHHAQLWVEGGAAWLRDLGSRNGSWRNGERVVGSVRLASGDTIRVGATFELRLQGEADAVASLRGLLHVEDVLGDVRLLVCSDRFLIGGGADCDLRVEGLPHRAGTIVLHDNGEIWVGTDAGDRQVQLGERFTVADRELRLVEMPAAGHAPTVEWGAHQYPYEVAATANAVGGPQASVRGAGDQRACVLAGNRGVLLVVLARKLVADRASEVTPGEAGWCSNEEVLTGVWGRGKTANHLNVLVHRLRAALEQHGFDPYFIEKRRGGIRLRCRHVEVT